MSREPWDAVDRYFEDQLLKTDSVFEEILRANREAGLPEHDVSPLQGKLLSLLCQSQRARSVLEIGTLGGYSTTWMARALPDDGRLITLERDASHAAVARANLERAGVADRVDIRVGAALETLEALKLEAPVFDFVFIDADKSNNAEYFEGSLRLSRPGTLIVIDNVVREGRILDAGSEDDSVVGVRRLSERLAAESHVRATAIQTVGKKGHDGFVMALVLEGPKGA